MPPAARTDLGPRIAGLYDFPPGVILGDSRGNVWSFDGWVGNRAGQHALFVRADFGQEGIWQLRIVHEDTLLRRLPGAARYKRSITSAVDPDS